MRIVGGTHKGRRISVPNNFPSRPTTDYAKEGLFNVLDHQIDLTNLTVLDLCSGTGNIALEFLSRGVNNVISVDINTNCLRFIQKNAESLLVSDRIKTIKSDIFNYVKQSSDKFDIIFADPPFAFSDYHALIELIFEKGMLVENGIFILEHGKQKTFHEELNYSFFRNYGNVTFSFFKLTEK
jgi:16S rRNA (guanine(966)-N(2))-methyltransferase RsmD